MWKDEVQKRYFWASMDQDLEKLLFELIKAEEEEDDAIYLLMMHYDHARQESPLAIKEREKVMERLAVLIGESRKHQKMIQEMIETLEKKKRGK